MGDMQPSGKIVVVTEHYPPDATTTATYIGAIAQALATDSRVVVLSGSRGSASSPDANPEVIETYGSATRKHALIRRAIAVSVLALRMFLGVWRQAGRDDVVFCVTTPFTLPYAAVLAAKLRGAAAILLIYDLYPEALVAAGLIGPSSPPARLLRFANARLLRALDAIVTIGRDVAPLLLDYRGLSRDKIHFIPNWTLLPVGYRDIAPANRFRPRDHAKLVVGLSGNFGFTHSPLSVFEAARLLINQTDIHFMLSGWGVGWDALVKAYAAEQPGNVTLTNAVPHSDLEEFLASADVWIIPYRKQTAGVSIPSRLYNLLAVGRAIIVAAEPQSEAALVVEEEGIGWVVAPEDPRQLAAAVRIAAADRAETIHKGRRAAAAAEKYSENAALAHYRNIVLSVRNQRLPPQ